jgi:hypothetical protein
MTLADLQNLPKEVHDLWADFHGKLAEHGNAQAELGTLVAYVQQGIAAIQALPGKVATMEADAKAAGQAFLAALHGHAAAAIAAPPATTETTPAAVAG